MKQTLFNNLIFIIAVADDTFIDPAEKSVAIIVEQFGGYIETDNAKELQEDKDRGDSKLARILQNRWSNPEDFKGPVVFLACNGSNYVNGSIITVDRGRVGR